MSVAGSQHDGADGVDFPLGGEDTGSASSGTRMPNIRLRSFFGQADRYEEWRREIEVTKAIYQLTDTQLSGMVYLALAPGVGKQRELMKTIDISTLIGVDGWKEMFKILDAEYLKEPYLKADDAVAKFEKVYRPPGGKMGT